ncbi:MAG: Nif3-like dinuclear metal center hexameric protein [Chromatiaceae bacterium]
MVTAIELQAYCDELLGARGFDDYCPNGLQVEGTRTIRRLVSGVTASLALIEAATAGEADAILVHHGWFWKGEAPCLTGPKGRRVRALIESGASLLAYHLPLDAHAELGNNRQLARLLGIEGPVPTGAGRGLVWRGQLAQPLSGEAFAEQMAVALGRSPLRIPARGRPLASIAWCSGAAQGFIEEAAALGVDAYLSGEISEQTTHLARELGIDYFAAGHYATERWGVQALGVQLANVLGLEHRLLDIDNPV